jgi:hypothetical protein
MHTSQFAIRTIIDKIRAMVEEPDINAKYTDDFILRQYVGPGMGAVSARLNLTSDTRVFLNFDFQVTDTRNYTLPPGVASVVALYFLDQSGGTEIGRVRARTAWHHLGPGWRVEGNPGSLTLAFTDDAIQDQWVRVVYTSTGDVPMHLGTGTLDNDTEWSEVTLAASPTLGLVDRRVNAYAGSYIRIVPSSGPIEERLIQSSSWTGSAWKVRTAIPFTIAEGSVSYEIAPAAFSALWHAVAAWVAIELTIGRDIPNSKLQRLQISYTQHLKTIRDSLSNMREQVPYHVEMATPEALAANPFTFFGMRLPGGG